MIDREQQRQARIAKNIADAKRGYRAAAAAGYDLDVVEGYDRVHGRAAFVRALKPAPLPDSIFRDDDYGPHSNVVSRSRKAHHPELSSTISLIEFRAMWFQMKPEVPAPAPARKSMPVDTAIALKKADAMAGYGFKATGVH